MVMQSKVPSAKGSRSASACTHCDVADEARIDQPVAAAREHGGVDVLSTTRPRSPTWRAMPAARSPVPPATSSARCPGLKSVERG